MLAIDSTTVIGAGPAGLSAAYGLARAGLPVCLLEMTDKIGGIARTEEHEGFLFDIGGHRFHSYHPAVVRIWKDILGPDLLTVPRSSHIFFEGRMVGYPLQAKDIISSIGFWGCLRAFASYAKAHISRNSDEGNLEGWLIRRFGRRLYQDFFKEYTEKVWGRPCREIQSDWAPQRIQSLSLWSVLLKALGYNQTTSASLISEFYYPRLGAGMMWEAMSARITCLGGENIEKNHINS